jgi:hypothetical protein
MKNSINKPVTITSVGFDKDLSPIPRQMEYDGHRYNLTDRGITCVVKRGNSLSRILTLSDGRQSFRLRNDMRCGVWTLLAVGA